MSRPSVPPVTGARAVLASGVFLGFVMALSLVVDRPHMLGANFEVYRLAAEAALSGDDFYAVSPDRFPHFFYLYPPVTVLAFLPFAVFDPTTSFFVHTALEIAFALALAVGITRWIGTERSLTRLDHALIVAFTVGSIHSVPSIYYGQVNLRMACFLGLGLYLLDRAARTTTKVDSGTNSLRTAIKTGRFRPSHSWDFVTDRIGSTSIGSASRFELKPPSRLSLVAGGLLALASVIKVFPAAIGILLLRVRAWWAIAGAVTTGLAALALGILVFGIETTRRYAIDVLLEESDADAFVGGLDPLSPYVTIRRPLSFLAPDVSPAILTVFAAVTLGIPLAYVYADSSLDEWFTRPAQDRVERDLDTRPSNGIETTDRLVAAHATVVSLFVFVPSYPLYYVLTFGTLIPTLYLVSDPLARRLLVTGALLANVVILGPTFESIVTYLPPTIADSVFTVGIALLSVSSPMLLGCLLMLAGCVRHRYHRTQSLGDRPIRQPTEDR